MTQEQINLGIRLAEDQFKETENLRWKKLSSLFKGVESVKDPALKGQWIFHLLEAERAILKGLPVSFKIGKMGVTI